MSVAGGDVFAGYTIERLLGSGGMGEVYLARHPRLPRPYALKIMAPALSGDEEFRERFNREAESAAALFDPHIVGVHDRGEENGRLWIAMDYIDGVDADELVKRRPAGMPVGDVVEIVSAVAAALDHAHQRGLLHRDVKPANILVSEVDPGSRRIFLADFGIARHTGEISGLTATNMTIGTVAYSAPEQLLGESIDGRSDQYALAASAFHLLAGRRLFTDANPAVVVTKQVNTAPPRLADVRPELAYLDGALQRALAKEPAARFDRCVDFANALRGSRVDVGVTGATPVDPTRPAPVEPPSAPPDQPPTDEVYAASSPVAPSRSARGLAIVVPLLLVLALAAATTFAVFEQRRTLPTTYVSTADEWQPFVDAGSRFATQMFSYEPGKEEAAVQAIVSGATGPMLETLTEGDNVANLIAIFRETNASSVATINSAGLESLDGTRANVLVAVSVRVADAEAKPYRLRLLVDKLDDGYKVYDMQYPDGGN